MRTKPQVITSRKLLAENIRIARAVFGWSQMQMGLECDLDRTFVGTVERGTASVGIDVLDKLAKGLGVPVNVLLLPPDEAQAIIYQAFKSRR